MTVTDVLCCHDHPPTTAVSGLRFRSGCFVVCHLRSRRGSGGGHDRLHLEFSPGAKDVYKLQIMLTERRDLVDSLYRTYGGDFFWDFIQSKIRSEDSKKSWFWSLRMVLT